MDLSRVTEAIMSIDVAVTLHRDQLLAGVASLSLPENLDEDGFRTLACTLRFDHDIDVAYVVSLLSHDVGRETILGWLSEEGNRRYVAWLKSLPYTDYLRTDHWKAVREPALIRDGSRCRLCNSRENLNVHHRTYERLGEEGALDLVTLCYPCHQTFHENRQLCNGPAPPGSTAGGGPTTERISDDDA